MSLRESLAMAICQAPEYSFRPLDLTRLLTDQDDDFIEQSLVCVCARDGRTPVATILRCCNNLAKADAVIAYFLQADVAIPE